jgi:hypothetical protein
MKDLEIHFGSTRFGTVACTVSVSPMSCVSFPDRHTGSSCAASSNPISFRLFLLKLCIVCVSCFVQVTGSQLLCKHVAKELSFPTFVRFLLPPSGSFPTLHLISVYGVHLHHVNITMSRSPKEDWVPHDSHTPYPGDTHANISRLFENLICLIRK